MVDSDNHIYCIRVDDGQDQPLWTICIQVHMPVNYPSDAPPEYQLNAPWMREEERMHLDGVLADIYCENIGESIIYLWVEKIREFIQERVIQEPQLATGSTPKDGRSVTITTETEDADDDFTLSDLESFTSDFSDHGSDISDEWECPSIRHGECLTDRRSTFQPHLAPVFHKSQIKMVLNKLYENKKIANATHNIMAYRIVSQGQNRIVSAGCDDDGETQAGSRMLHLLQILNVENVMVVVSRWYGGIHLGADRFKHINNCTRTILDQAGYITNKDEKKGPKSSSNDKKRR